MYTIQNSSSDMGTKTCLDENDRFKIIHISFTQMHNSSCYFKLCKIIQNMYIQISTSRWNISQLIWLWRYPKCIALQDFIRLRWSHFVWHLTVHFCAIQYIMHSFFFKSHCCFKFLTLVITAKSYWCCVITCLHWLVGKNVIVKYNDGIVRFLLYMYLG